MITAGELCSPATYNIAFINTAGGRGSPETKNNASVIPRANTVRPYSMQV